MKRRKDTEDDFWRHDRALKLKPAGAFSQLSIERKICIAVICFFSIIWCFYMGLVIANALAPEWEGSYLTADDVSPFDGDMLIPDLNHDGVQVVLIVGCDKRPDDIGRTDTIIIGFIDIETKQLRALSIPRDTYVTIPGGSKTKINHAYSYGGIPLVKSTIESNFGIEVDNYVEVDFNGFVGLVDAVDGVELDVPLRMYNALESIDLQPGLQTLDGSKALQFVRYREQVYADIGRIQRQQQFLTALAHNILSPSTIIKIPQLVNVAMEYVKTDLTAKDMLALASLASKTDLSTLEMATVPGDGEYINRVSYWVMDETEKEKLIRKMMGEEEVMEPETLDPNENDPDGSV